jgi:hypothetical protein
LAASVTTVLNRLVEYDEARTFFDDAGLRVWGWVSDRESNVSVNVIPATDVNFAPAQEM